MKNDIYKENLGDYKNIYLEIKDIKKAKLKNNKILMISFTNILTNIASYEEFEEFEEFELDYETKNIYTDSIDKLFNVISSQIDNSLEKIYYRDINYELYSNYKSNADVLEIMQEVSIEELRFDLFVIFQLAFYGWNIKENNEKYNVLYHTVDL